MSMLSEAKKSHEKSTKDDKKKKKKHPAAPSVPGGPEDNEAAEGEKEGDAQQPGAEAEGAEEQDSAGGAASPQPPQQPQATSGDSDQGGTNAPGDQGEGGQPAQQGGAQGGSPVPSPAAPGAGDTTSGGDDTPDQDPDQDGDVHGPETPGEDTAAGPGSNTDLQQVPMSPGLKDEYDKANTLLMQLLYQSGDDKLATALITGLSPQGPAKIKNAAHLSLMVVIEIHKKLQLPAQLILPFAKDVVAHVLDLSQQVKNMQWSDQESTAVLGAVYEGALHVFGVTKGQVKTAAHSFGRDALQKHNQAYLAAHAQAKSAADKNNQDWHDPSRAPQQGQPQTAGPQTGAPVGSQSATTSGAPPQPPVPPAAPTQGGGMLQQAAAQPQQEVQ